MIARLFFLGQLTALLAWSAAAEEFEKPAALSAREWWGDAAWLKTNLWEVDDEVRPDDFTNHYSIHSVYGDLEAWSDQNLLARLREIAALHWLRQQGAGRSSGRGAVAAASGKIELVEELATTPLMALALSCTLPPRALMVPLLVNVSMTAPVPPTQMPVWPPLMTPALVSTPMEPAWSVPVL
jgi:hypothetical protein